MYGSDIGFPISIGNVLLLETVSGDVQPYSASIALEGAHTSFEYLELNPLRTLTLSVRFSSGEPAAGWRTIKCTLTGQESEFSLEQRAGWGSCAFATPSFG